MADDILAIKLSTVVEDTATITEKVKVAIQKVNTKIDKNPLTLRCKVNPRSLASAVNTALRSSEFKSQLNEIKLKTSIDTSQLSKQVQEVLKSIQLIGDNSGEERTASAISAKLNELIQKTKEYYSLSNQLSKLNLAPNTNKTAIEEYSTQLSNISEEITTLKEEINSIGRETDPNFNIDEYDRYTNVLDKLDDSAKRTNASVEDLRNQNMSNALTGIEKIAIQADTALQNFYNNFKNNGVDDTGIKSAYADFMSDLADSTLNADEKLKKLTRDYQLLAAEIAKGNATGLRDSRITREMMAFHNMSNELQNWIKNTPKLKNSPLWPDIERLEQALSSCTGQSEDSRLELSRLKDEAQKLGLTTENLGEKLSRLWKEHFQTAAVMAGIHLVQQGLRGIYQNVVEIDSAMTELKKVTNETDDTYSQFLDNAGERAQRYGSTITDIVNATADAARLGLNIEDASSLADASVVYKNVGDGIESISDASESVISTMKAFEIEASNAMTIVDKFNEVGKIVA